MVNSSPALHIAIIVKTLGFYSQLFALCHNKLGQFELRSPINELNMTISLPFMNEVQYCRALNLVNHTEGSTLVDKLCDQSALKAFN